MELGDFAVEDEPGGTTSSSRPANGHDALAGRLDAVQSIAGKTNAPIVFGPGSDLDQTSSEIAAPVAPLAATKARGGAKNEVAGGGTGRVLWPWLAIAAGRKDGNDLPGGDGRVAATGVVTTLRTDFANRLFGGDLAASYDRKLVTV